MQLSDKEVFDQLRPYARRASRSAAWKYGVDSDDAEQQIYLVTLVALRGGEVGSLGAFLRLKVRDGIGKAIKFQRRSECWDDVDEMDIKAETHQPDMALGGLSKAVEGVTKEALQLLVRMYAKDENMAEIAEETGKSRQSVQQAHKRAIEKIRSNMGVVI